MVLIIFDVFLLSTSAIICLITFIYRDPTFNTKLLLNVSAVAGSYGFISAICNCVATIGIKKGRRCFLLPFLTFLPMVMSLLFIILVTIVFTKGVDEVLALPIVICLVLAYIWLKLLKQWSIMSQLQVTVRQQENIESELAAVLAILELSPGGGGGGGLGRDPPPDYESLEEDKCPPPSYEEAVKEEAVGNKK